ncbi:hypothetical protein AHMF7605_21105 [Adhaeribacter arboris]|uniref:Imm33-like domain-containing protein n=1 Tax=Adhaeribacter arboris TaxID=2072846 RepID=A0A2T2YJX8_9BACT|nr:hypothetical protein [Adhaeribacter arboris]PSR55817.1 hypothetical protein AHMF7605_21105 [Adhaeribacter arboris]
MPVTRQDLIQICDQFLNDEISKEQIENYAWTIITSEGELTDEIIDETLIDWDNENMNFPINKANMQLWKKRLTTGIDELPQHNIWNVHIDEQKEICKRYNSKWTPINNKLLIGVSDNLTAEPIHGLRHPSDKGTTGWFIWTGDYSEADDFFKPMCAEHLLQIRPQIIKYLGLDIGFRFLADSNSFEDIWYDETLKQVD